MFAIALLSTSTKPKKSVYDIVISETVVHRISDQKGFMNQNAKYFFSNVDCFFLRKKTSLIYVRISLKNPSNDPFIFV